jgi:hypothetical protein
MGDYLKSQAEWSDVFDALELADQAGWVVWLEDPFREGLPIFSRVNRGMKKGVVINQILPADDEFGFRAYLDIFAPDSTEDLVEHVVITATLTPKSKESAATLLRHYLRHQSPPEKIVAVCEELTG